MKGEAQGERQEHQEHQDLEDRRRVLPSRPDVLGVDRRRERSEGVVLDGPPEVGQLAHLKRGEGLVGRDDPEGFLGSLVRSLEPLDSHASDLERMGRVRMPESRKGFGFVVNPTLGVYTSDALDLTGRGVSLLQKQLGSLEQDKSLFLGGLDQEMSAQLGPAKIDHALGEVQPVSQDDVDEAASVLGEGALEQNFAGRQLLAAVGAGFKIDDRCMSPEDLQHRGVSPSEGRAVDGGSSKDASLGQRDLAVAFLAQKCRGLVEDFSKFIPMDPGQDPPEGGIAGDHVPIGPHPPAYLLLAPEEVDLVEAPAPKREAPHQKKNQSCQRDPGMLADVRESLGFAAKMELVVAILGKVRQTGRCPPPFDSPSSGKERETLSARARTVEAPVTYRTGGGFVTAYQERVRGMCRKNSFSLFAGARAAPRPAPNHRLE